MTPQEHQLLDDFLGRLQAAGPASKDPEADALIRARLDGRPDAAYLLVQRNLLMDRALAEANQQLSALRQQLATAAASAGPSSFLGSASQPPLPEGFGRAPSQAYTPDARYEQQGQPQAQPQPAGWRDRWFGGGGAPAAQQAQPQPQPQMAPAAAAGSGFLGRAATTAAGVAGGMFLFNGIEHLMGGHNNNGGMGGGNNTGNSLFGNNNNNDGGSLSGPMTENITENVFVNDDSARSRQGFLDEDSSGADNWASNDDGGDYTSDDDNLA
jgi:hypothetical protein